MKGRGREGVGANPSSHFHLESLMKHWLELHFGVGGCLIPENAM